jgi:hypothetical protein
MITTKLEKKMMTMRHCFLLLKHKEEGDGNLMLSPSLLQKKEEKKC